MSNGPTEVPADKTTAGEVGLAVRFDGHAVRHIPSLPEGIFQIDCPVPSDSADAQVHRLDLSLLGVTGSNFLAWLGRVTRLGRWQPWRRQARNRRLRIQTILADDEVLFDFSNRASPWNSSFARRFLKLGLNLVGYFRADLGIGESVRCMARAADAAGIRTALVDLRLPCRNTMSDNSFARRLQVDNPHRVNIIHVDPPGMRDLDHHHGAAFRRDKYNIGYWAWELPEFPDAWIQYSDFCQEVWAPSNFAADSIAEKVPVPVLVMPHAIAFDRPVGDFRPKFGLPPDRFLFLFLYDLNSYSERKNPAAVIEAFRSSGLAGAGAALVIKVHNVPGNEADFERLRAVAASLPGTTLITQTLSRRDVYELESACDSFVSLHRSEGFGLAVAECMYSGQAGHLHRLVGHGGIRGRLHGLSGSSPAGHLGTQPWSVFEGPDVGRARYRARRLVDAPVAGRPGLGREARGGRAGAHRGKLCTNNHRGTLSSSVGSRRHVVKWNHPPQRIEAT